MNRITKILFSFLFLLLSSLTIISMEKNEEEIPSLKTRCMEVARTEIVKEFGQLRFENFIAVCNCKVDDIRDGIFSQEYEFNKLMFSDTTVYSLSEFKKFGQYLKNIKLSNIQLNDRLQRQSVAPGRVAALLHSTALTCLDMSMNGLRQDTIEYLTPLSGLKKLNLAENSFWHFNLEGFPNLTYLNLADNGLSSFNLGTFPNLAYLNLRNNKLDRIPSYELTSSRNSVYSPKKGMNFCLSTLDVSENLGMYISDMHVEYCATLTSLNLQSCKLRQIDALSLFTNLQILNLMNNSLHGNGGIFLNLTNLTSLNIANTGGITSEDTLALGSLLEKKKVTAYLGKKGEKPIIIGPHPELFDINTP